MKVPADYTFTHSSCKGTPKAGRQQSPAAKVGHLADLYSLGGTDRRVNTLRGRSRELAIALGALFFRRISNDTAAQPLADRMLPYRWSENTRNFSGPSWRHPKARACLCTDQFGRNV